MISLSLDSNPVLDWPYDIPLNLNNKHFDVDSNGLLLYKKATFRWFYFALLFCFAVLLCLVLLCLPSLPAPFTLQNSKLLLLLLPFDVFKINERLQFIWFTSWVQIKMCLFITWMFIHYSIQFNSIELIWFVNQLNIMTNQNPNHHFNHHHFMLRKIVTLIYYHLIKCWFKSNSKKSFSSYCFHLKFVYHKLWFITNTGKSLLKWIPQEKNLN